MYLNRSQAKLMLKNQGFEHAPHSIFLSHENRRGAGSVAEHCGASRTSGVGRREGMSQTW